MSFGGSIRNGLAIGLRTIATLGGATASTPIIGVFLATESLVILATESGGQLLVEPIV
jgi:hypothetical protein